MKSSTAIIVLAMVSGIAVLALLGFWQLDRLEWKEALIARVDKNLGSKPVPVNEALAAAVSDQELGVDYRPLEISGEFSDAKPIFEFTTFGGKSGWNVYSLLSVEQTSQISQKPFAIINRGFIEFDKREEFEQSNLSVGKVDIVGLLRSPPKEQPSAAYDNDIEKRTFYWRDIKAMAKLWKSETKAESNWYVDAGLPNAKYEPATTPMPGTTLINFPNSHLQYAFTWFGLAFALLGVGSYFLYSRRTNS